MRIMIDTNILISAILFPTPRMDELMRIATQKHKLILSTFVMDELTQVVARKFKGREKTIDDFLTKFSYELVYTPKKIVQGFVKIRDEKDYPVLYTAIIENADILISGDKDFSDIDIEKPEILTPAQFLDKYAHIL